MMPDSFRLGALALAPPARVRPPPRPMAGAGGAQEVLVSRPAGCPSYSQATRPPGRAGASLPQASHTTHTTHPLPGHRHPVAAPASLCRLLEPARRVVSGHRLGCELRHARCRLRPLRPLSPLRPLLSPPRRLRPPVRRLARRHALLGGNGPRPGARVVEDPSVATASSSSGAVPSTCRSGERAHSASGRRVLGRLYARYRPQGRPGRRAAGCACAAPIWRRVIRPFRREQLLATLVGLAPRAPLAEQPSGA